MGAPFTYYASIFSEDGEIEVKIITNGAKFGVNVFDSASGVSLGVIVYRETWEAAEALANEIIAE
jgi:hypothetical protein